RMARAIQEATDAGCSLVLAAGGDGTVSAVANVLARLDGSTRPVLGIIPLGTANVLARELEVPIDTARALAMAAARRNVVDLDAMRVGDRYFLTQLGTGLDAKMIAGTSREEQQSSGRWAYMRVLVREMSGHRSHRFELTIDGRRYRKRAWQVVVANAKTMGTPPFTWGPDIEPTDGVLNVGVYNVRSAWDWVVLVTRFLTRRHLIDRRARYFRVTRTLRIASRSPLPVQGDGDLVSDTPVDVEVAPALLKVVVGPEEVEETAAATAANSPHGGPVVEAPPGPVAQVAAKAAQAVRLTLWKRLAGIDHAVYLWVNALHAWPPATWLARAASRTMDHGELWAAVALLVLVLDPAHDWESMAAVIAVLSLVSLTVNFPIKSAFRRQRPFDTFGHADVRVTRLPRDWSFPSGHSATAFAGAALLTPFIPALSPLLFAYAAAVALSRVYLGVHYPVDVLLGGAVGIGLAALYMTVGQLILGMR
ncbi:MAG: phosphatase PAP2 family protein, partial [Candidatus Eisenbacteria bacterium]